jgi:predicted RNase H-like nuclease (RuvC/YqgF family)
MEMDELALNLVRAERECKAAMATITKLLKDLSELKKERDQLKSQLEKFVSAATDQ